MRHAYPSGRDGTRRSPPACSMPRRRNAQHYACRVLTLGTVSESRLTEVATNLNVPGLYVTTDEEHLSVQILLYDRNGAVLTESSGLARIRRMIETDQVPRPVNSIEEGRIEQRDPLL